MAMLKVNERLGTSAQRLRSGWSAGHARLFRTAPSGRVRAPAGRWSRGPATGSRTCRHGAGH